MDYEEDSYYLDRYEDEPDERYQWMSSNNPYDEESTSSSLGNSLIDQIYSENQREVEKLENIQKDKNWIPENLMLTTQNDLPIIYINSTKEKPEIYPIKLATITLNAELPINFNLKIIALYIELDEFVIGVKHEQICQRGWFKQKSNRNKKKNKKNKGRKDKCDFYNQCTLNVRPYGLDTPQLINMKLFPNGKIGFTGVKRVEDAEISLRIVLDRIDQLYGRIMYFPKQLEWANTKNFRKKIKVRQKILEYITNHTGRTDIDWDDFIDSINTKGKNPYPNGLKLPNGIGYALCFLEILNTYYQIDFAKTDDLINDPSFPSLFETIKMSYRPENEPFETVEIELLTHFLAANQRYLLSLDEVIEHIKNEELEKQKIILQFYLQTNANYTVEQIISALDQAEYTYTNISLLKNHLIPRQTSNFELDQSLTRDQIIMIHQYFSKIKKEKNEDAQPARKKLTIQLRKSNKTISNENEDDDGKNDDNGKNDEDSAKDQDNEEDNAKDLDDEEDNAKDEEDEQIDDQIVDRFFLELPAWSDKRNQRYNDGLRIMNMYSPDFINISNINTTFNTNFVLSREKLHQILVNKYGQTNCSFEPNYGGIKLTYLSVIDCPEHDDPDDPDIIPEYNDCQCKGVSVLIFPNITLITGGRSFRQIMQAYQFIKSVMIREFEKIIKIDQNSPDPLDKYPNMISSNRHVFLKKKFILDNPKNHFIIKKMGLLEKYQWGNNNENENNNDGNDDGNNNGNNRNNGDNNNGNYYDSSTNLS